MKLSTLIMVHSLTAIILGISFGLYSPLMMAFFEVSEALDNPVSYWHVAAFARMFGAALLGMGLLLLAIRSQIDSLPFPFQRAIISALLIANLLSAFVAVTQQLVIWLAPAGWLVSAIYGILSLGYALFLVGAPSSGNQTDSDKV